jgi:hypothetical protein
VGIREEDAPRREFVQMRGVSLGMSLQAPQPVVQIINCDEEDLRPLSAEAKRAREEP